MGTKWVVDPETGEGHSEPMTPEEELQLAKDQKAHGVTALAQAQSAADDTERLRTINERARTDPAYKALADMVLRGVSR